MRFHVLSEEKAKEILDLADPPQDGAPDIAAYQSNSGAGDALDGELIEDLRSKLDRLRDLHADDTKAFDALACELIHQALPNEPELVSSDGFWRWLALGALRSVTMWRFPPSEDRIAEDGSQLSGRYNRQNFGIGASARQRAECYPYKLWLRAELGYWDDGGDAYRYARRGDVDFWTSHVHRQSYTTNRELCSALVRFQYPDSLEGKPNLLPGTEKPADGRLGIRTLAKRLRRMQASFELNVLDADHLYLLVSEQALGLTHAD